MQWDISLLTLLIYSRPMLKTSSNTCVRSKGKSEWTHRAFFFRLNFPHVRSGTRAFGNAFLGSALPRYPPCFIVFLFSSSIFNWHIRPFQYKIHFFYLNYEGTQSTWELIYAWKVELSGETWIFFQVWTCKFDLTKFQVKTQVVTWKSCCI